MKNCLFSNGEADLLGALRKGEDIMPLVEVNLKMKKVIQRNPMWTAIVVIGLILIGAGLYSHSYTQASSEGVVVQDHIKGNPEGELILVKYGDFQCPFCAAAYPAVDQILEEFGDYIRFEYKHLPLEQIHPHAFDAAVAAEAAGQQDQFFAYHDLLYDRQSRWSRSSAPSRLFLDYAQELGLDLEEFKRHQAAAVLKNKVRRETAEASRKGYTGTPSFELNGARVPYQGYEQLRSIVAQELAS